MATASGVEEIEGRFAVSSISQALAIARVFAGKHISVGFNPSMSSNEAMIAFGILNDGCYVARDYDTILPRKMVVIRANTASDVLNIPVPEVDSVVLVRAPTGSRKEYNMSSYHAFRRGFGIVGGLHDTVAIGLGVDPEDGHSTQSLIGAPSGNGNGNGYSLPWAFFKAIIIPVVAAAALIGVGLIMDKVSVEPRVDFHTEIKPSIQFSPKFSLFRYFPGFDLEERVVIGDPFLQD